MPRETSVGHMDIKPYLDQIEERFAGQSARAIVSELRVRRRDALRQFKVELGKTRHFKQLRSELGLNLPLIFADCIVLIAAAAGMRKVLEDALRAREFGQSAVGHLRQGEAHLLVDLAARLFAASALTDKLLRVLARPEDSHMGTTQFRAQVATAVEGAREVLLATVSALGELSAFPEMAKVADFAMGPVRSAEYAFLAEAITAHLDELSSEIGQ
jgi:hypothetical protein